MKRSLKDIREADHIDGLDEAVRVMESKDKSLPAWMYDQATEIALQYAVDHDLLTDKSK